MSFVMSLVMPYIALILFFVIYLAASLAWDLPQLVGAAYLVISLTCFVAYAMDKSAARSKAWRPSTRPLSS